MKTCFIYTGQARTFAQLWRNHAWFVHRHFPNADFFVSVADDEQSYDMMALRSLGHTVYFEKVVQPEIPEPDMAAHQFGYPPSTSLQAILRQFWALNRAWEFVGNRADNYNLFIRIRPDSRFTRFVPPAPWERATWFSFARSYCLTPWWARWGGVNDRFALLGRDAAEVYFTTFQHRQALFDKHCPCHPETLLAASLESGDIVPDDTLACEFMTVRLDGKCRPIDPSIVDVADYSRTK